MSKEFKKYLRTNTAEMRPVTEEEIKLGPDFIEGQEISISTADIQNGSPTSGDMIARNPENHADQWLVAKQYFQDNFIEKK